MGKGEKMRVRIYALNKANEKIERYEYDNCKSVEDAKKQHLKDIGTDVMNAFELPNLPKKQTAAIQEPASKKAKK